MNKKPIRLAVADDQHMFRKGLLAQLRDYPEVSVEVEASNGEELMELLKKKRVDVVLLDLEMPKMDGFEATDQIRKKYPGTNIIVVTSHNEESFIKHLIKKGAGGFILKDQDIEIVMDAIYSIIETGYYFNEKISNILVRGLLASQAIQPNFAKVALSDREIEVIRLISKEYTADEIAAKLYVSKRTIDGHRERIQKKIKARNVIGILMYAFKHNLLEI